MYKRLKTNLLRKRIHPFEIRSPYLSIFKWNQEESFAFGGEIKILPANYIAARRKNVPFVIRQEGIIHFYHNLKIRGIHIFSYGKIIRF